MGYALPKIPIEQLNDISTAKSKGRYMSKSTIKVVARIQTNPDRVDQVRSILSGVVEPTRKETGCISYELLQNRIDPTDFTFVEEWESETAIDAHLKTEHVTNALKELTGLVLALPDIRKYNSVVG